jgi:hypothetical protein
MKAATVQGSAGNADISSLAQYSVNRLTIRPYFFPVGFAMGFVFYVIEGFNPGLQCATELVLVLRLLSLSSPPLALFAKLDEVQVSAHLSSLSLSD